MQDEAYLTSEYSIANPSVQACGSVLIQWPAEAYTLVSGEGKSNVHGIWTVKKTLISHTRKHPMQAILGAFDE